jgi:hypothetical protein
VNVNAGQLDQPPPAMAQPVANAPATPPLLTSQALAQAIQQAATHPAQAPHKKNRVWEPSPVEIQQQPRNPRD